MTSVGQITVATDGAVNEGVAPVGTASTSSIAELVQGESAINDVVPNDSASKGDERNPLSRSLSVGVSIGLWVFLAAFIIAAWCNDASRALGPTLVVVFLLALRLWAAYKERTGEDMDSLVVKPTSMWAKRHRHVVLAVSIIFAVGLFCVWVALVVWNAPERLIPAVGLALIVAGTWLLSANRQAVSWRPVISGMVMQMFLGLIILRTEPGLHAFQWLGDKVAEFLLFTDEGSRFVFGDRFAEFFFAFKVMPVTIFFSSVVAVLFHLGILQQVFMRLGWLAARCMGTTDAESLVAAANIFIGQTEAPLLVAPFLPSMTKSEIHAVMTTGFSTIAGGVMAAYIAFDIPADHLLAASVMSCPAALALAKLSYPETEHGRLPLHSERAAAGTVQSSEERNVLDAMASGATSGAMMVANIVANLIAFVAAMAFLNSALSWLGSLVGIEGLTFDVVFSYVLWPMAFMMGVPAKDCREVGKLLGEKTFINEFVAYRHLADLAKKGVISARAQTITTYALCGFSNFGSIGVQLGGMGAIAPSRKHDLAELALRPFALGRSARASLNVASVPAMVARNRCFTTLRQGTAVWVVWAWTLGVGSDEAGQEHLAANAQKEGVTTLDSGLQYRVIASAQPGAAGPASRGDVEVLCHYEGWLVSGQVFDSSYKRGSPATFKPKNVIKGWSEALSLMHVGDKWELAVPSELAYGSKGAGKKIPPDAVLMFVLEVLEIRDKKAAKSEEDWDDWLHGVHFTFLGFRFTRMITMPFIFAVLASLVRAAIMAYQQSYCVARHINTKTEEECYKALSRVNKGEDFSVVAKEVSKCRSAQKGGSLGKFYKDTMAPEFDKLCFDQKTEVGKVYGPLKTQFGYHILIVDERFISENDRFEDFRSTQKRK